MAQAGHSRIFRRAWPFACQVLSAYVCVEYNFRFDCKNLPIQAMIKKRCVISLGIPAKHQSQNRPKTLTQDFVRGLMRIERRLRELDFDGDFIYWDQDYPKGSPPVEEVDFAFKPFCLDEARSMGYTQVLWVDSSILIKEPLDPLFRLLEEQGYLIFDGFHSVGEYCKDEALATLEIEREESFELPSCSASVLGLNLEDQRSLRFLQRWKDLAADGITFMGPKWSGVRGWPRTASQDPRVKGHRHDQLAASVIALKLGMDQWAPHDIFSKYFDNERELVRQYQDNLPNPLQDFKALLRKVRSRLGALLRRTILKG